MTENESPVAGGDEESKQRTPSVFDSILPLVVLVLGIGGALVLFGLDALDGPIQVALFVCCGIVALIAMKNGHGWEQVQ